MLMLAACKVPHTQATSGMQHSKWAVLHNVMYSQRAAEPAACCQASEGKLELVLSWWEVDQGLCQSCTRCRRTAAGGASVQCQKGTNSPFGTAQLPSAVLHCLAEASRLA